MKNLFFLLSILLITSCADEIEYPSTYLYESTTIDLAIPLQIVDGQWIEPEFSEVPEAMFSPSQSPAFIEKLEFVDDAVLNVTDSFGEESVDYTGRVSFVSFDKDGQRIEMRGQADGGQFTVKSIASGDFDGISKNVYITTLCGDIINCNEINPYDWVGDPSAFPEGTIQYVLIKSDVLKKRS